MRRPELYRRASLHMPDSQQDIDALLAEVNALAEEAVATITDGDDPDTASSGAMVDRPPSRSAHQSEPYLHGEESVSRSVKSGRLAFGHCGPQPEDVNRILHIEVPIIVQLSQRTMPLSEILDLTPGSIIEFTKPSDGELELKVNNKIIGSGQAVKVGENFGLRVARIGSLRERIQALGGV